MGNVGSFKPLNISIHALLAESDPDTIHVEADFYPRSPCGERHDHLDGILSRYIFLSTLSLRRATLVHSVFVYDDYLFLSTLSLRRATITGGY